MHPLRPGTGRPHLTKNPRLLSVRPEVSKGFSSPRFLTIAQSDPLTRSHLTLRSIRSPPLGPSIPQGERGETQLRPLSPKTGLPHSPKNPPLRSVRPEVSKGSLPRTVHPEVSKGFSSPRFLTIAQSDPLTRSHLTLRSIRSPPLGPSIPQGERGETQLRPLSPKTGLPHSPKNPPLRSVRPEVSKGSLPRTVHPEVSKGFSSQHFLAITQRDPPTRAHLSLRSIRSPPPGPSIPQGERGEKQLHPLPPKTGLPHAPKNPCLLSVRPEVSKGFPPRTGRYEVSKGPPPRTVRPEVSKGSLPRTVHPEVSKGLRPLQS